MRRLSREGEPGRQVCGTLFDAIWRTGVQADDAGLQQQVWQQLTGLLPEVRDPASPEVKAGLIANGEEALSHGVWGVPTLVLMPQEEGAAAAGTGGGAAIFTSSKLRSANEPISQSTISFTAQGLGARDRARDCFVMFFSRVAAVRVSPPDARRL